MQKCAENQSYFFTIDFLRTFKSEKVKQISQILVAAVQGVYPLQSTSYKASFILVNEFVENSVNKKMHAITVAGKEYFYENITKPMLYKDKNMELGKFIFMGFVPKEKRTELIEAYISELKKELDTLVIINLGTQPRYAFDESYIEYLKSKGMSDDITNETFMDIAIELKGVEKSFKDIQVLKGVDWI